MNEQMYSVGPIMKAARKFRKLNQAEVAQAIGCSQSALSKMEHNLLIPSAPQWFLFARFTSIPPEALEMGIIDRHSPVRFNSNEVSLGFKIPKRYRQNRSLKIRELYPFLQFLERESPSLVKEFIVSTGLEPEFFLDFDNLVNFNLVVDMLQFLHKHNKHQSGDIKRLVEAGQNDIYWDRYGVVWKELKTVEELLDAFVKVQSFFQMDFQLRFDKGPDETITFTYLPEYHLKQSAESLSQETAQTLNLYRKFTLENLVKRELGQTVEVNILSPALQGKFEIKKAA